MSLHYVVRRVRSALEAISPSIRVSSPTPQPKHPFTTTTPSKTPTTIISNTRVGHYKEWPGPKHWPFAFKTRVAVLNDKIKKWGQKRWDKYLDFNSDSEEE
jgi:hypothetical protein